MLGKLIKNEFRVSAQSMIWIYSAVAVTIAVMGVSMLSDQVWLGAFAALAMLVLSVLLLAVTVFSILSNFNKTLYGNQGYLTFSLPVRSGSLLASKAVVAMLWLALSFVMFVGLVMGTSSFIAKIATEQVGEQNLEMIKTLIGMFKEMPSTYTMVLYAVYLVITLFIFCFLVISAIFFAVTLANTRPFQKHMTLWIILFALVEFFVLQNAYNRLTFYVPLSIFATPAGLELRSQAVAGSGELFGMGLTGNLFYIGAAICLIVGTSVLMKRKVNIR